MFKIFLNGQILGVIKNEYKINDIVLIYNNSVPYFYKIIKIENTSIFIKEIFTNIKTIDASEYKYKIINDMKTDLISGRIYDIPYGKSRYCCSLYMFKFVQIEL